jgi:hypothetical protein
MRTRDIENGATVEKNYYREFYIIKEKKSLHAYIFIEQNHVKVIKIRLLKKHNLIQKSG